MAKQNKLSQNFAIALVLTAVLVLGGLLIRFLLIGQSQPPTARRGTTILASQIERVSLDESKVAFDNSSAVFLDVRSQAAFDTNHIPGAVNSPLAELEFRLDELDPDDWIVTYCT